MSIFKYLSKALLSNYPVGNQIQIIIPGTERYSYTAFPDKTDIVFAVTYSDCIIYVNAILFGQLKKNIRFAEIMIAFTMLILHKS